MAALGERGLRKRDGSVNTDEQASQILSTNLMEFFDQNNMNPSDTRYYSGTRQKIKVIIKKISNDYLL